MSRAEIAAVVNFAAAAVVVAIYVRVLLRRSARGVSIATLAKRYSTFVCVGLLLAAALVLIGIAALTDTPSLGICGSILLVLGVVTTQIGRPRSIGAAGATH
jgi:hypothetical protein